MGLFPRLCRLIWGADVEPALRPLLAVSFVGSAAFSAGWSFVGIWAISQAIVARLAPEDLRGAYMGAFGSMSAVGFALGPFTGLQPRGAYGDDAAWYFFAAVSLVAAATGAAAVRGAARRRVTPATVGY